MVLTTTLWFLYKATSLKANKEPKLTMPTALFLTYYMVFPQGPILGSLLLIFIFSICDKYDIASYAGDSTPYTSEFNLEEVIQKLELTTNSLFK